METSIKYLYSSSLTNIRKILWSQYKELQKINKVGCKQNNRPELHGSALQTASLYSTRLKPLCEFVFQLGSYKKFDSNR